MTVTLDLRGHAEFRADQGKRTITGLVVAWGKVSGNTGGRRWRFARNSLHWSDTSRIKLNLNHDRVELVGKALELWDTPRGLMGAFKVSQIPEGDRALQLAADGVVDGFSIEVDFDPDERDGFEQDPEDPTVRLARRATLRAVALTGMPAFDDARVESVAATRDERLQLRLTPDELDDVRATADVAGVSVSEIVRRGLNAYTNPRPVYSLSARPSDHSLVRDLWVINHPNEGDSIEAEARYQAHRQYEKRLRAQFATVTTSNASQVIEPGYRPLLASIEADRALWGAATQGELTDATPFTIPADITEASIVTGVSAHVQGTNPTDGTLTFTGKTITPAGVSGLFKCTREVVDGSNPAVDQLAFSTMRADWDRHTEGLIFTELNTEQAGTITGGQVPSGAQARTSAGAALPSDLRKALLTFPEIRKTKARSVVASTRTSVAEPLETLDMQAFPLQRVSVDTSPFITGTAAGDGDVFIVGAGDLWAWASPLLEFTYAERSGPALIELALFGYFAVRLVKPQGLASIRHT